MRVARSRLGRRTRGRLLCVAVIGAVLATQGIARAAVVDHGKSAGLRCSDIRPSAPCLLAFGPAATEHSVVAQLAVGEPDPRAVRVARPDGAGGFTLLPIPSTGDRWKPLQTDGEFRTATAIPLKPGDYLVLIDPLVRGDAPSLEFDPHSGSVADGSPARALGPIPFEPAGRIAIEPDADQDGWGDESQDLCPGVPGMFCETASPQIEVTGELFVPAWKPVMLRWSARNAASTPQPMLLTLALPTATLDITGPAGLRCWGSESLPPADPWVGFGGRSELLQQQAGQLSAGTAGQTITGLPSFVYPLPWRRCLLPALAPGATAEGTVTGTGVWSKIPAAKYASQLLFELRGRMSPVNAPAVRAVLPWLLRPQTTAQRPNWRPQLIAAGRIRANGAMQIISRCKSPTEQLACTLGASLSVPGGGVVARARGQVTASRDASGALELALTRSGRRWLAAHPRAVKFTLRLTSALEGFATTTRTSVIDVRRSAAFARELRRATSR